MTIGAKIPQPLAQAGDSLQEKRTRCLKKTQFVAAAVLIAVCCLIGIFTWDVVAKLLAALSEVDRNPHSQSTLDAMVVRLAIELSAVVLFGVLLMTIAFLRLRRNSGVECPACHEGLWAPKNWYLAEETGRCPFCRSPLSDLFPAGTERLARPDTKASDVAKMRKVALLIAISSVIWTLILLGHLAGMLFGKTHSTSDSVVTASTALALAMSLVALVITRRKIAALG